jgi:tetratricopeptide (TPR) repeat protein
MRALLAAALLVVVVGCDSRATTSDPAAGRAEQKSREYESCGASVQCQDELRCFDQACRRIARSTLGDYYAAAGALARAKGDLEAAIAGYAQALGHYDAEKVALPPDVDCAYGATLAAAKAKKEHAELGAHVLHRCVLAVPVGSRLRDQALAELAALADAGLDPVLLGANKVADLYLTRGAARPATDKLTITVTPTPAPAGKSYSLIPDKLNEADIHTALVACWEAYSTASKKDALTVVIGLKASYIASEYEDEPGRFTVKLDPPVALPVGSAEAAADACVRQVLEPALKGLKITDAFTTKLAVTIK